MYYGYLNDTIFREVQTVALVDRPYDACIVDRTIGNYFHKNTAVHDPRPERLTYESKTVTGKISYCYDLSKNSDDIFSKFSTIELSTFFKMIEMVYMSNSKKGQSKLNQEFMADKDISLLYKEDSLSLSVSTIDAVIYNINDTDNITDMYQIKLPVYFDFSLKYGEEPIEFRIYLARDYFLENYPLSTINKIIEPCNVKYLLDVSKWSGSVDALVTSNEHSFEILDQSIISEDHSGLFIYKTRFVVNDPKTKQTTTQWLPFGVLYQGSEPSVLEVRKVIREQLLDYGIASKEVWEEILPDLFITGTWYIIPCWDNTYERPDNYIYPSVINLKKLYDLVPKIFPDMDKSFIEAHMEALVVGKSEIFLAAIPDPLNETMFDLFKLHPTYQYHLMQDGSAFLNMDVETRDFNTRLNIAIAVAMGESVSASVQSNKIDDLNWHTFVSGKYEFNVLSKDSYIKYFALLDFEQQSANLRP